MTSTSASRRLAGVAAAVVLGIAALSGCAAGQISQTADQVPQHDGAQGTVGPVGVHTVLLARPDKVEGTVAYPKGASVPVYLWVTNDAIEPDTLSSISTPVGTVAIDGDATVPGQSALEIGGSDAKVTATITGLTQDLKYGFPVQMTFYFDHAGQISVKVPIQIPAQRAEGRKGTDIYPAPETNVWGQPEPAPADLGPVQAKGN